MWLSRNARVIVAEILRKEVKAKFWLRRERDGCVRAVEVGECEI